ncbi:MAG: M14 family zinc carboxypeptidase, partial [Nitrososphaerota archaeon]
YRDIVRVVDAGSSRCGERIRALIIGRGSKTALLFGAPHPNEPIGTLTLEYLTRVLASDEELRKLYNYTWVVVKAVDVDGLKMNEGWFKKPFTIETYAENYYRPAGNVQIE